MTCGGCGKGIDGAAYAYVTGEGYSEAICSEACVERFADIVMGRNLCEGCGEWCPPDDRAPTSAGGIRCTSCGLKLTNAFGFQLSALMNARGMAVVKGGRS